MSNHVDKAEWRKTTVGEAAPFVYGKSLPRGKRNESGNVPVYGSNGIIGYHDTPLTDKPTIIVGRKGTIGTVHYSPAPCWPIDTTFYICDDAHDDIRFRYYALKRLGLERMNSDTAVPGLNRNAAHAQELSLPPLPTQRAISRVLGAFDDKIALNAKMNATLEAMARALFRAWFVDFEPVRAKRSGRWRRGETLPGMPAALYDLFPSELTPTDLGDVPAGWEARTIGDLAHVSSGKRPPKRYRTPSDEASIPVYGGNGVMAYVEDSLIDYPILLTGRVGTLGSVFRVTAPCWASDNTLIVKPIDGSAFDFLRFNLERVDFRNLNRGSTQPLLAQSDLKAQPIVVPPNGILEYFQDCSSSMYNKYDAIIAESRTLAAMRDTLLPRLLSGEVRVE